MCVKVDGVNIKKEAALSGPPLLEYMYLLIFYARVILSERRQRVHTFTFLVSPSTIARTLWMFGFQVLFVRM